MPNNRSLPSAHLFSWLLSRAIGMAASSYDNAARFGQDTLPSAPAEAGVFTGAKVSMEAFLSKYAGNEAAAMVSRHDQELLGQMKDVADAWAQEFSGVFSAMAPLGPGFAAALQWLGSAASGSDRLGYLGHAHRMAQAQGYADQVLDSLQARQLPMAPGAGQALRAVVGQSTGLLLERLEAQMLADRQAERMKLRVDAAEALLRAYDDALAATADYLFTQMHLMFDVFGRNNDFLVKLQRDAQQIQDIMELRTAELASWEERILTTDDSHTAANQKLKSLTDRVNTRASMSAESHIKLLRRYSSRAAAALNSVGVRVGSTAYESNNIDAEA